jgi:hypothetical protein
MSICEAVQGMGNWAQRKIPRTEEPLILRPGTRILLALLRYPGGLHSIDRIDTNGNYQPGNVRWATQSEQTRNQHRWQHRAA